MSTLVVPPIERRPWPTLGPAIVDMIEEGLVFGPGDLLGQPAKVDDETRALIFRMYEVFPKTHPRAGRRRFKRVALSLRKGLAKTEKAAWITAIELHPEGPVRCDGWRRQDGAWLPVGAPVTDPYIPMVAYTEEQTEDLAYGALKAILELAPLGDAFDIGLERIQRLDGHGKALAMANSPSARDGARTTFQHFDETHHFTSPRLRRAHKTMLLNIPKRRAADAWSLETTTMYGVGEDSVAEGTHDYARAVEAGRVKDSRLFFFHRGASDEHDLDTPAGVRAAALEASGPHAEWSDIDAIVEQFAEPDADVPLLRRLWLNVPSPGGQRAFDVKRFKALAEQRHRKVDRPLVALAWHGDRYWNAAALMAVEIRTGYLWPFAVWQRPDTWPEGKVWEVPDDEVDAAVGQAFETLDVWKMYVHPDQWQQSAASWAADYGTDRVVEWKTNAWTKMAQASKAFADAITSGEIHPAKHPGLLAHVGACNRRKLSIRDEAGRPLWVPIKERPDSPHPINMAMGSIMAWQARLDALKAGALEVVEWRIA